jgi:hypothetical protein
MRKEYRDIIHEEGIDPWCAVVVLILLYVEFAWHWIRTWTPFHKRRCRFCQLMSGQKPKG